MYDSKSILGNFRREIIAEFSKTKPDSTLSLTYDDIPVHMKEKKYRRAAASEEDRKEEKETVDKTEEVFKALLEPKETLKESKVKSFSFGGASSSS